MVSVEITDKGAIYVSGTRITDRSTKWGSHTVIDQFSTEKDTVVDECLQRGHSDAVRKIDDPHYTDQRGARH